MARVRSLSLALLLDEMISPTVAAGLVARSIDAVTLQQWEDGRLLGKPDPELLDGALQSGRVLVTFDLSTIPLVLSQLHADGVAHAGVVFVSTKTIGTNEFGALIESLHHFATQHTDESMVSRALFLTRTS